ncbi:SMP-30/gluconolactonase/LRE family protein [Rhizobium binxianense]
MWWTDIPGRRLHRIDPETGIHDSFEMPGRVGCFNDARAGSGNPRLARPLPPPRHAGGGWLRPRLPGLRRLGRHRTVACSRIRCGFH